MSGGIEKIQGVESARVSLNQGVAAVRFKPGNTVRLEQLYEVVTSKGFTPKEAKVAVLGEIMVPGGKLRLKVYGTAQFYDLQIDSAAGPDAAQVQKQAGKTWLIEGVIPAPGPKKKGTSNMIQLTAWRVPADR